jgi:4-nitrophenyl phosphatase
VRWRGLDKLHSPLTLPPVPLDLNQFEAVLLDLDGTVYHEEHALPGAVELIRRLQREERKYACLTNSTSSPRLIAERLARMGVDVDPAHIYTAAAATADYVIERFATEPGRKPRIFNLSTEGVAQMLDGKVEWVQTDQQPCDAIICGVPLNPLATPDRQRTAMLLARQGAALLAICADRIYPSPRGLEFGVGALAAMLAYAAGVQPIYCGKPEKLFFHELCNRLAVDPARCLLIGDNLESDIAGAKNVGMRTLLTLTGITTRDDAAKLPAARRPDGIVNDLRELVG